MLTMSCDSVIADGAIVVLQKFSYLRTHTLKLKKQPGVQLGQDIVDLSAIEGQPWETTFKMVPVEGKRRHWTLQRTEQEVDFEEVFLGESESSGDKDNRHLVDENSSQKLSRDDIERLRDEGKDAKAIIGQLIQNSDTFDQKTKFSQAKFLKKKAKKYAEFIVVRKPSIRLLMQIFYKKDPVKMMNMRMDTLSRLLTAADIYSGGNYIVYETGCQGVLVAAVLERIGSLGRLVHVFETGNPQTQSLNAMNFSKDVLKNLTTLNMYHLRSLEQGDDILQVHAKLLDEKATSEQSDANDSSTPSASKNEKAETKVPYRQRLREESVQSFELMKSHRMDGLVIACRQHPTNLLLSLVKYLAPSAPFAIFSPYKEPLLETYMAIKDTKRAVMVTLSETWLRNIQVLPERSHPEVLMSGGGGYILSGIYVDNSEEGLALGGNTEDRAANGRSKKRFKRR